MAASNLNFILIFGYLLVIFKVRTCKVRTFLKQCFITDIFLQCFITARTLETIREFSKIRDLKHSRIKAATEKSFLRTFYVQ